MINLKIKQRLKQEVALQKSYFFSLSKFILISFFIFTFFTINGYFFASKNYSEAEEFLKKIEETIGPVLLISPWGQFLFVLLNNSLISFLTIIFGLILGIFPFFVLSLNGIILGVFAYFFNTEISLTLFFLGILPHGIIEIPTIIISAAIGFRLAGNLLNKLFKRKVSFIKEFNLALGFFLKVIFPFLLLASLIEIFITARIIL